MGFQESLRLSIALGLTIFLVLLRFDSERIMRSDYFRTRSSWLGPLSYYGLVVVFAIGIMVILPRGRAQLFIGPGEAGSLLPVMLAFAGVALVNAAALAFLRYRAISPLPTQLLASRLVGAAANAFAEELQFRSIVLGMLLFAFGTSTAAVSAAVLIQALLYGLVHRRLWLERDWYFLGASVILGYAAGLATVNTGSVIPAMVGHFAVTASLYAFAGGRLRQAPV